MSDLSDDSIKLLVALLELLNPEFNQPLHEVVSLVVEGVTKPEFDSAVNLLLASGLVAKADDGLETTPEGLVLSKSLRRLRSAKSQGRALTDFGLVVNPASEYAVSDDVWADGVRIQAQTEKAHAGMRLEILEGIRRAISEFDQITAITQASRDYDDAKAALLSRGYAPSQVHHVLSLVLFRQTEKEVAAMDAEIADLRSRVE